MKKTTVLFLIFIGSLSMAQVRLENLKKSINEEFNSGNGTYALAFKELRPGGEELLINAKENFHAASTMKTPVMIEVFKQAAEGKFSMNDSVEVKNSFKSIVDSSEFSLNLSDDGGEGLYNFIGKKRTVRQLVFDMITVSSNLATNILIDKIGAKNVMKTMKEMGANDIKVLRGVEDIKAYDLGMNNTTTAYDLMLIFEKIAGGDVVSKEACKDMISILLDQKFNSRIPAELPKEVKVAHKTGSISGVEHDSGIVFLPDGRKYVLVILAKNLKDMKKGTETEAKVSRLIYDFVISEN